MTKDKIFLKLKTEKGTYRKDKEIEIKSVNSLQSIITLYHQLWKH